MFTSSQAFMTVPDRASSDVPARLPWTEVAAASIMALLVTVGHALLDRQPLFWDEYYHLLAGRAWAADGTFLIGEGFYGRGAWLSASVGWMFRTFGEGVVQARMVPAILHAASICAVFAWVYRRSGRLAAWAASIMLATAPVVLVNAVMVRFYGAVSLLVVLCAVGLDHAVGPSAGRGSRIGALAASAACAWMAYLITPLSRVWISGLLAWALGAAVVYAIRSRHRVVILSSMALAASAYVWMLWSTDWISQTWSSYREAPGWDIDRGDDLGWYARMLRSQYPTLATLFPLAAVLSVLKRPRMGGLCFTAFTVGFLILSGGGPKAERYAVPLLSFFFVLWGLAFAELLPALWRWTAGVVDRAAGTATPALRRTILPALLVTGVTGFVLISNPGFVGARHWAVGRLSSLDRLPPWVSVSPREWDDLAGELRTLMDDVEVVVTANTLQMLYHVGHYDYGMRPTVIRELVPAEEFGIDPRDGRPAISTLDSLIEVVHEHETGLIVGERWRWGSPTEGFDQDVEAFVYANMDEIELSRTVGLRAYRWGPGFTAAGDPFPRDVRHD